MFDFISKKKKRYRLVENAELLNSKFYCSVVIVILLLLLWASVTFVVVLHLVTGAWLLWIGLLSFSRPVEVPALVSAR